MMVFHKFHWTKIVILVALTLVILSPAALASQLDTKRNELQEYNAKIEANRSKQRAAEERKGNIAREIQLNDQKITELQVEISKLQAELDATVARRRSTEQKLSETQKRLEAGQIELAAARNKLTQQRKIFNKRLVNVYKNGDGKFLAVLLNSQSFTDLISRAGLIKVIEENDGKLIRDIQHSISTISDKIAQIEAEKRTIAKQRLILIDEENKIAKLKNNISIKQNLFENELSRQKSMLTNVTEEKNRLEHTEIILSEGSALVAKQIRTLERIEAEKQRALERKRQLTGQRARAAKYISPSRGDSKPTYRPPAKKASNGRFIRPCSGSMTSKFGWRFHPVLKYSRLHAGIDFGVGTGTPIYAAQGGTVILAGGKGGYGNTVVISHGGGVSTLYAHNSRLVVRTGQHVSQGQIVSYSGSTGLSTGPHLHFEVRVNGVPKNPMNWL